jgi:hypothetical protein
MIRTILVLCVSFFAMSSMAWELKQPSKTAVIEMMDRWNIAVAEEKADLYFVWNDYDRFPHPTFKGGSKEAYEAFTKVLIKFLSPNNIAFIRQNNLVELPIHCNTQVQLGSFGTFSSVVRDFAQYGEMVDYSLREKLFMADQELDRL